MTISGQSGRILGRDWSLILGPPGTGKTSQLMHRLEGELGRVRPTEIAFVSFTRSARMEAKQRAAKAFGCVPEDLTWFRTVHSTALRLLNLRSSDLMTKEHWDAFVDRYGYDFSSTHVVGEDDEDYDFDFRTTTHDDALLSTLDWGRNRCLDLETAIRRSPFHVDPRKFHAFVNRYLSMKEEKKKVDFHDLLEQALIVDERPPVRVAFIDEAQDLSPLQVKLVERWFFTCERVYVAGDDDQAIFTFMGGDPSWMIELSEECRVEILEKSFRVPGLMHDMAQQAIRPNKMRVDKIYRAKEDQGVVKIVNRKTAVDLIREDEDTFVLARNWRLLRSFAKDLRGSGTAFVVEKFANWSPLGTGHGPVLKAWKAVLRLRDGSRISARELDAILAYIPVGNAGKNLVPRGTKSRAKENKGNLSLDDLRQWGLVLLADAVQRSSTSILTKVSVSLHKELEAITRRYGKLPTPTVTLTSMHSSKGREAETVIIISDMSKATYKAYTRGDQHEHEAENRIAYVAITRAKRRLLVCTPESNRFYPYELLASRARIPERTEDDWQFGD